MTSLLVEGGVPQRLKPGWFLGASYAALEAPLFHVTACFRGPTEFPYKIRIKTKINVKGVGQECPTHTYHGNINVNVKGSGRGRPLYIRYANSRPSGWWSRCQASR
jgi:hypothetical protein